MIPPITAKPIKYIAEVKGGREVTLVGAADFGYWTEQLAVENLLPVKVDDRAEVLLSAVQLQWMGLHFNEISVSIRANMLGETDGSGVYLASAFNTSRLFSFIERNCFHTPYCHAHVEVCVRMPWSFKLTIDGNAVLAAKRNDTGVSKMSDGTWEVSIHLPTSGARTPEERRVFFARLSGATETAPFSPAADLVAFIDSKKHPIFRSLIDSHFTGIEWRVRNDATHARSKTFRRGHIL